MKCIVTKEDLSKLVRKIQNIVPQSAPIPILSHVLVEATEDELVFIATDLTVGSRCSVKAKVIEKGGLSIPSKRFFQLIRELTDSNIEIVTAEGEMAEIKSGSSRFRLHGMDSSEYPSLPDFKEAVQFPLPASTLKEMLYRTSFAVSKEDSRFVLTGVLMRIEAGYAIFVGTDGKRLAKVQTPIPLAPDISGEYIIPLKAVEEVMKGIEDDEDVQIYLSDEKIAFESTSSLLVTKLLAGEYPDFEQVIASQSEVKMSLHREELITLLKQISLFTTNTSQSVRFSFQPGELILTANCTDVGEGKVSMPVHYSGERLEIAFNPFFFLDILKHSRDETVTLGVSDPFNPGLITDSTEGLFVLMPMRLSDEG